MSTDNTAAKTAVITLDKTIDEEWAAAKYTRSLVAFIDVMGMSNSLMKDPADFDSHKSVYKIWDRVSKRLELKEYTDFFNIHFGGYGIKHSIMSDSVVLSIDADESDALYKLLVILRVFYCELLSSNPPYFLRGAITVGNLYHNGSVVFGPALVEAAKIEKNDIKTLGSSFPKTHTLKLIENQKCPRVFLRHIFAMKMNIVILITYSALSVVVIMTLILAKNQRSISTFSVGFSRE